MSSLKKDHKNKWQQDEVDPRIWSIWTEPKVCRAHIVVVRRELIECARKVGIGQRCCLLETEAGNILWDLVSLLDEPTVQLVCSPFASFIDRES